jgi:hypothetical protein
MARKEVFMASKKRDRRSGKDRRKILAFDYFFNAIDERRKQIKDRRRDFQYQNKNNFI